MAYNDASVITKGVGAIGVGAMNQFLINRNQAQAEKVQLVVGSGSAVVGGLGRFLMPRKASWARNLGEGLLLAGGTVLGQAGVFAVDAAMARQAAAKAAADAEAADKSADAASGMTASADATDDSSAGLSSSDDLADAFG